MIDFSRWSLSPRTRASFNALLDEAPKLGLDPQAIAASGLPGLRGLLALKLATESVAEPERDEYLAQLQETLRTLEYRQYPALVQQFQARVLALQGRGSDTEIAHVTPGEIVIPRNLQTRELMRAVRAAAENARTSVNRLRVGSTQNRVNPSTGAPEFFLTWLERQFITDEMERSAKSAIRGVTGNAFDEKGADRVYNRIIRNIERTDAEKFAGINPATNPITLSPDQARIVRDQIAQLDPEDRSKAVEAYETAVRNGRIKIGE